MFQYLSKLFTDTRAGASVSIAGATVTEITTNPAIQAIAVIVAIVAGVVAIINGIDSICVRHRRKVSNKLDLDEMP